jgi:hypothetical protein
LDCESTEELVAAPLVDITPDILSALQASGDKASPPSPRGVVFLADGSDGPDLLDMSEALRPLIEACAHRDTQTPLTIGVVGPSGSGKSFALERLRAGVDELASAAAATSGPFLSRIVTVPIDAAAASGDPASAIAAAAFTALGRDHGGVSYAALADEAAHASADPYQAANKALERHDDSRRRLDAERQARDDVEARRARLIETTLYETAGSRVDAYARGRRGSIEARLRRFDLVSGDSTANYRDLVRDLAGAGWGSRIGVVLSSIWAYRSQRRLLAAAIVLFALAFGAQQVKTPGAIGWLRSLGSPSSNAADWLAGHVDLVGNVAAGLLVLGLIALAVNLWRALFFTAMLFRGVRLLNYDVRERQRDLDASTARLNRRVAALTAETETTARQAEEAERRANARGRALPAMATAPPFLEPALVGPAAARAFLAALGKLIVGQSERAPAPAISGAPPISARAVLGPRALLQSAESQASPDILAPDRLFLAFDNLDALPPAQALNWIETAHSSLGPSFVAAFACDPALLAASGDAVALRGRLDKLFQLTLNARSGAQSDRLISRLTGVAPPAPAPAADARQSLLSEPLNAAETGLLAALAPLAARTPRGVKRFLNAYRIARTSRARRPALALMLALGQSGDEEAAAAMNQLLAGRSGILAEPSGPPALIYAVGATREAADGALTVADLLVAKVIAARYRLSP